MALNISEYIWNYKYRAPSDRTIDDTVTRVASGIATNDEDFFNYLAVMRHGHFVPGGRILANAGLGTQATMANCFVMPQIEDSIDGIFEAVHKAAKTLRAGGGIGMDFSTLRPRGAAAKGINGTASGPVSFMKIWDATCSTIMSAGNRRGAMMGVLRCDHPDILEFINAKREKGNGLTNFNISVALTDNFMSHVSEHMPHETAIFEALVDACYESAEPGALFIDTINRKNKLNSQETIYATNPCVTGDTLVSTTIGQIPIKYLTQHNTVDVYTRADDGSICIKPAKFFRTSTKSKIVEVKTSRGSVKCTCDHLFLTPDGWVKAGTLRPKQRLIGLNKRKHNETHLAVAFTGGKYVSESRLVAEYYWGDLSGKDVHHLNGDQYDNSIQNLQALPKWIHSRLTNIGHEFYAERDPITGAAVKSGEKKKKDKNVDQGAVGTNWYVVSVCDAGTAPVFDGSVEDTHNYVANGIVVHNCGEQPLPPNGACILGSMNLAKIYSNAKDYNSFISIIRQDSRVAARFLDNVIDKSHYPLDEQRCEAATKRRIGLGVMGYASMLAMKGVKYGSPDALEILADVLASIQYAASSESNGKNSHLTCIAPTGTTAMFSGNVSSGIEPIFAHSYTRNIKQPDGSLEQVTVEDYSVKRGVKDWTTVNDLSIDDHLRVMKVAQDHVDGAVSKTINCPVDTPKEKFKQAYITAWQKELKGITLYRPNDVTGEVLVSEKPKKTIVDLKPRPGVVSGATYKIKTPTSDHAMYVTINDLDGKPYEIFFNTKDVTSYQWVSALSRTISAIFRRANDSSFVSAELKAIFDPSGGWWQDGKYCPGLVAAIGTVIDGHISVDKPLEEVDTAKSQGVQCPKCGNKTLIKSEGCENCLNCGYSKCG